MSGGVSRRRRMASAALFVVLATLLGGCAASIGPGGSTPTGPSDAPSASAGVSATPIATPTTSPTPAVTPTAIEGALIARVVEFPDVYVEPISPRVSIYADGTVVSPGWADGFEDVRYVVRRLTPSGLAAVRAEFDAAVVREGTIGAIVPGSPGAEGGYATYRVSVRRDGALVTATTTNASSGPGVAELLAFAERWLEPVRIVLAADGISREPALYQPAVWWLQLAPCPDCTPVDPRGDVSAIAPVIGPLATFGESIRDGIRCGTLDAPTAAALRAALGIADGATGTLDRFDRELSDGAGSLELTAVPALPDEVDCPFPR